MTSSACPVYEFCLGMTYVWQQTVGSAQRDFSVISLYANVLGLRGLTVACAPNTFLTTQEGLCKLEVVTLPDCS